jgi:hypothetical protein
MSRNGEMGETQSKEHLSPTTPAEIFYHVEIYYNVEYGQWYGV